MSAQERSAGEVRVSAHRCPYCHEEVPRGEEPGVCAGCHALHHRDCLVELGRCAACGVERERPTAKLVAVGKTDDLRRRLTVLATRLTLGAMIPCVLISLLIGLVDHGRTDDAGLAWVFAAAALNGAVATLRRGALLGWGVFSGLTALGLLTFLWLSEHARQKHAADIGTAAALLGIAGVVLVAVDLWRRRRSPTVRTQPSQKGS